MWSTNAAPPRGPPGSLVIIAVTGVEPPRRVDNGNTVELQPFNVIIERREDLLLLHVERKEALLPGVQSAFGDSGGLRNFVHVRL